MPLASDSPLEARPPVSSAAPADGFGERVLWALLSRLDRGGAAVAARRAGAAWMRLAARTDTGYEKGRLRVARRTPMPTSRLVKPPESWSTTSPLVRTRRGGLTWELDLRDNLQRTLYFTGTYERGVVRLLELELRAGDIVADIGAHVGVHALRAAARLTALGGGRVIAFEPTPDSAARLRAGAARNGLDVEVHELALGDRDGTVELRADARYGAHDAGVRSRFGAGPVVARVPQTTFDAWAERAGLDRLDVVKLDIEGGETLALEGMQASLRSLRPRLLIVEVKDVVMARGPGDEARLRQLTDAAGYAATGDVHEHNAVFRPRA